MEPFLDVDLALPDRRDGKVRVMGYNSPFVWKSQRFFEIEIPVRKRARAEEIAKP